MTKEKLQIAQNKIDELRALAAEKDAEIARLREALEEIAYMGMDCPMQGDRDYFNESQLRKCVSIGANALAKKKDTT